MNDFLQTFFIATIPSICTAVISFWASCKASNTQLKAIKEQNKADIEKLVEQNRVDIEALKEKHRLDMEAKDKEHNYQLEVIRVQHENAMKKDEENMKNQFAANAIGGLVSGMFSQESPISKKINEQVLKGFEDAMKSHVK